MAGGNVIGDENLALGGAGTIYNFTTSQDTNKYRILVVNNDAVFSEITDDKGNNLLTLLGISGTVSTGMVIRALNGHYIASYTLTSGSVAGVL